MLARLAVVLAAVALLPAACYETPKPHCAFRCGTGNACPTDYVCDPADSICHLQENGVSLACEPETAPDARGADAPAMPIDAPAPDA